VEEYHLPPTPSKLVRGKEGLRRTRLRQVLRWGSQPGGGVNRGELWGLYSQEEKRPNTNGSISRGSGRRATIASSAGKKYGGEGMVGGK